MDTVEHTYIEFKKGERILTKGDDATCAYLIESGKVRVFIEDGTREVTLATLDERQIFGETAIISGGAKYGANIEAAENCKLRIITASYLNALLEETDPAIKALLLMLSERLKNTNEALVKSETREYMDIALI